jgi:hypothetical protein
MSQNVTLDVAIGLILLVLIASLLGSAIVETVGGFFHRRSKNLWDTIDLMLGEMRMGGDEEKLVDRIYRQPFVTKLVQPKAQPLYPKELAGDEASLDVRAVKPGLDTNERKRRFHGPQHIAPEAFASAFIDAIQPGGNVEASVEKLKQTVAGLPPAISEPIGALLADVGEDFVAARGRVERWYQDHMQAVSVWYRRQTRYFLFAAGLVIAVVANLDPVAATTTLYRDEALRESVLDQAQTIGATACEDEDGSDAQIDCLRTELGGAVAFPVGWSGADHSFGAWSQRLIGWILVAGAVTVGAPFWFDLLRRALAHRKSASEKS